MPPADPPTRTCVGCRRRCPVTELLRVVVQLGVVVCDEQHRLPGRGAHVHATFTCLDAALRRRAFGRALRHPDVDLGAVQALTDRLRTSAQTAGEDTEAARGLDSAPNNAPT